MLPADVCADGVLYQRIFVRSLCARKVQAHETGVDLVFELIVKGVCGQPQGGWGQPQQPQGGNQFSGGAQSRPQQSAPAAPSNEPPMDFDDDIPF